MTSRVTLLSVSFWDLHFLAQADRKLLTCFETMLVDCSISLRCISVRFWLYIPHGSNIPVLIAEAKVVSLDQRSTYNIVVAFTSGETSCLFQGIFCCSASKCLQFFDLVEGN